MLENMFRMICEADFRHRPEDPLRTGVSSAAGASREEAEG